jgi:vacuolar-type H+-ATPase subunit I/STV1
VLEFKSKLSYPTYSQTIKIKEAEDYLAHMSSLEESKKLYSDMIEKVEAQVVDLKGKLDIISERLKSDTKLEFHEMQDFIINRLTSFGCAKHQGYVMQGFALDSEMASYLFLEPSDDGFEFNETTKPDYVILMNRLVDQDLCAELEQKLNISDDVYNEENEMKRKLEEYQ